MWLSPQFTPSALFIGVLPASLGLSLWPGLPAIVIGNIIGAPGRGGPVHLGAAHRHGPDATVPSVR
jgi:hypothetical protein